MAAVATVQAGAGERSAKDSGHSRVSFCLNFSQAISAGREKVWCWSLKRRNFGAPLPTHTPRPSVTPFRCPTPHCKSSEGSAPASLPSAVSASFLFFPSLLYSNLSSFTNPEVSSKDECPGQGTRESREGPTGEQEGLRSAESAGCRGKRERSRTWASAGWLWLPL